MDITTLHTNQKLLVEALIKKGASVQLLDPYEELLEITYNGKKDFLMDRFSSKVPFHVVKMTADKYFTKKILQTNHISTPVGSIFTGNTISKALEFAKGLYPVVLKPNWGSHGDHVKVNILDEKELNKMIKLFIQDTNINEPFLIEKYYDWKEYRLFITVKEGFAVIHREPASIMGNGFNSIEELVPEENKQRALLKKEAPTCICPIKLDQEVDRFLLQQGIESLSYVPNKNKKLFLRNESNLAKGGKAIDMTDSIHPSYLKLALKTLLSFPSLPMAGLDLLSPDISQEAIEGNYTMLEVNSSPGLSMHTYPTEGKPRDVANLVLAVMFPDWN